MIIRQLSFNSRQTILAIAENTDLSMRIISYRIKNLTKNKLITQHRCSLDLRHLGLVYIKVFIKLLRLEKKSEMIEYLNTNDHLVHNVESLGEWELEPEFELYSIDQFYKIINKFKTIYAKHIDQIDSMIIEHEHKYQYIP